MAYTNNVPQGNQRIATTQPIIQANFSFVQNSVGTEHNFNAAGTGTDTYHLKTSMPNRALSPALPAGTNGVYFVNSNNARYYDGTNNWFLNVWTNVLTGNFTSANSSAHFSVVGGIPNNTFGVVYFYRASAVPYLVSSGQFYCESNTVHGFINRVTVNGSSNDSPIELVNDPGTANTIRAFCSSSTYQNKQYNYLVLYRPA